MEGEGETASMESEGDTASVEGEGETTIMDGERIVRAGKCATVEPREWKERERPRDQHGSMVIYDHHVLGISQLA